MKSSDIRDKLLVLLDAPIAALGLDLEAVELAAAGKRSVLKIAVDKDGGPTMDDITDVTRAVSATLDETDAMGQQAYTLEVSSRGVDRPLTLPRHWRRNVGRLVTLTSPDKEAEPLTGRIVSFDDEGVTLSVLGKRGDGSDATETTRAFADIKKARIQIEFKKQQEED